MKKTLTVNLNGMVFHIDEDAYQQLHEYLNAVRASLDLSDDKDEIMADIEARIAELLTEEYSKYHTTIATVEIVRTIMTRLGEPKDYAMDSSVEDTQENTRTRRRYYRDAENAMLGGVAAGLAAFLGWDVVWIRLIFVGLILLGQGWPIFVYVLMWIIAKPALTVAQKLEMKGEPVTIDSIQESFNEMAAKTPSASKKALKILSIILKTCFFVLAGFFGLIALIFVIALLLVFMGVSVGFLGVTMGTSAAFAEMPWEFSALFGLLQPWQLVMAQVSLVMLYACPLIILIAGCVSLLAKRRWTSKRFNLSFCVVWSIALCSLAFVVVSYLKSTKVQETMQEIVQQLDEWEEDTAMSPSDRAYELVEVTPFNALKVNGAMRIVLIPDSQQTVAVRPAFLLNDVQVIDSVLILNNMKKNPIDVEITTPHLNHITLEGACQLKNRNAWITPALTIEADGAAEIDLHLLVEQLALTARGASQVELKGSARHADFNLKGAVELEADEFCLHTLDINVDGATDSDLWVTDSLGVTAHGFSRITYRGTPNLYKKDTSMGVKLKQDKY